MLAFAYNGAILGNQTMSRKDQVGARFTGSGGCVNISGNKACRLLLYERAAVFTL